MTLHKTGSTDLTRPLSLTKPASVMLALCLLPTLANAQTIINKNNLTDTFGNASVTGQLINQGTITVNRNGAIGMQGGVDAYLSNQSAITVNDVNGTGISTTGHGSSSIPKHRQIRCEHDPFR